MKVQDKDKTRSVQEETAQAGGDFAGREGGAGLGDAHSRLQSLSGLRRVHSLAEDGSRGGLHWGSAASGEHLDRSDGQSHRGDEPTGAPRRGSAKLQPGPVMPTRGCEPSEGTRQPGAA